MLLLARRVVVVLGALLLGATLSVAQPPATITGVVSDPTGAPVVAARVELAGGAAARSATSDAAGRYRFEASSRASTGPGDRARLPGQRAARHRERRRTSRGRRAPRRRGAEGKVNVTGEQVRAQVEAERALTPGGVTVVDGDELYSRNVTNIADMLRYVPGVWSPRAASGSEELFFSSRGSNLDATDYDKNGIKLLQDGLPVTTADGNNHNRVIDPLSARYAIVARGANALTYGASTLGGAIDFISPTARNSAPLSVFVNGGSHGSLNGRVTAGGARERVRRARHRRRPALGRLSRPQRAGARRPVRQCRLAAVADDQRPPLRHLHRTTTAPARRADARRGGRRSGSGQRGRARRQLRQGGEDGARRRQDDLGDRRRAARCRSASRTREQSLYHPIVDQIFVDFDGPGPNAPVEVFSLLIDTDHRNFGAMVRYDRDLGGTTCWSASTTATVPWMAATTATATASRTA